MSDDIVFDKILHYVCENYDTLIKNDNITKIYETNNYLNNKINNVFDKYSDKDKKIIMLSYMLYLSALVLTPSES